MFRKIRLLPIFLFPLIVSATIPLEDEELEEIVTTGMRVSQGGAQDIKYFRGEVEFQRIPHPNDLTAEGLMSEHDIVFPAEARAPSSSWFLRRVISSVWVSPPTSMKRNGAGIR